MEWSGVVVVVVVVVVVAVGGWVSRMRKYLYIHTIQYTVRREGGNEKGSG